jgi:hypothetical protein
MTTSDLAISNANKVNYREVEKIINLYTNIPLINIIMVMFQTMVYIDEIYLGTLFVRDYHIKNSYMILGKTKEFGKKFTIVLRIFSPQLVKLEIYPLPLEEIRLYFLDNSNGHDTAIVRLEYDSRVTLPEDLWYEIPSSNEKIKLQSGVSALLIRFLNYLNNIITLGKPTQSICKVMQKEKEK